MGGDEGRRKERSGPRVDRTNGEMGITRLQVEGLSGDSPTHYVGTRGFLTKWLLFVLVPVSPFLDLRTKEERGRYDSGLRRSFNRPSRDVRLTGRTRKYRINLYYRSSFFSFTFFKYIGQQRGTRGVWEWDAKVEGLLQNRGPRNGG